MLTWEVDDIIREPPEAPATITTCPFLVTIVGVVEDNGLWLGDK